MELADLVSKDGVITHLKVSSKKQLLQELAQIASDLTGLTERKIFDTLVARERLGSTGVGGGIAIPHGKLADINRLYGVFVTLQEPIDYDAVDGVPVDIIFLLLAPEDTGADHLKALARISRRLRDARTCEQLRKTNEPKTAYSLLTASISSLAQ